MTGRCSIRSGLSLVVLRGTPNTLQDGEITPAEVLRDASATPPQLLEVALGIEPRSQPQNQGLDEYYGVLSSTDAAVG
jgi:arylsulfatase